MKHLLNLALGISMVLIASSCASNSQSMQSIDNSPITGFEPDRYLGTWYEIARFDHSFERNLTGVTATYKKKPNGTIKVINAGYRNSLDGKYSKATGKAKLAGDPDTGHLKVSFFLFFYSDYYILALDREDYQWALVGSSSPGYLWILARTPTIPVELYESLVSEAAGRGYATDQLIRVPQKADR